VALVGFCHVGVFEIKHSQMVFHRSMWRTDGTRNIINLVMFTFTMCLHGFCVYPGASLYASFRSRRPPLLREVVISITLLFMLNLSVVVVSLSIRWFPAETFHFYSTLYDRFQFLQ
jgi:hypothetical protein